MHTEHRQQADHPETVELAALTADFNADPHTALGALRDRGPVHHVAFPNGDTAWMVLGYEQVRAALADTRLGNDVRLSSEYDSDGLYSIGTSMLQVDPPDHTRLRSLVAREFTARRIGALRARVEERAHELLDGMAPRGRAELVEEYALPLPLTVICELLGVPGMDTASFRSWSTEMVAATDPEAATRAMGEMTAYLTRLIEDKRTAGPASEGDLLHALVRTHDEDGDRLDPGELLGMAFLLLVAGHETTVNSLSSAVHLLLSHPDQLAALRADPELAEGAVEETLRFEPPAQAGTFRYAAEALTIAGTHIGAGDRVVLSIAAANRDPGRFHAPERFDIHRDLAEARAHLAFGHGVHHCLGAPLARLETAIGLRALLERFPGLAYDATEPAPEWRPSLLRGLRTLPVRF